MKRCESAGKNRRELSKGQGGSVQAIEKKQGRDPVPAPGDRPMQEKIKQAGRTCKETAKEEKPGRSKKALFAQQERSQREDQCLDKEVFRLQNQKEKLDERLENQVNYMWNEYELTYSTAERFHSIRR